MGGDGKKMFSMSIRTRSFSYDEDGDGETILD
jgi:hypothetical protein